MRVYVLDEVRSRHDVQSLVVIEVQVAPCGLLHKAKLVQVHVILQIKMLFIMLQMVYGISCRYGHGAQISAAMSASKAVTRGFSPIEGCR